MWRWVGSWLRSRQQKKPCLPQHLHFDLPVKLAGWPGDPVLLLNDWKCRERQNILEQTQKGLAALGWCALFSMRCLKDWVVSFSSHSSKAWSIHAMLASKVTGFTLICKKSHVVLKTLVFAIVFFLSRALPPKSEEEEEKKNSPRRFVKWHYYHCIGYFIIVI